MNPMSARKPINPDAGSLVIGWRENVALPLWGIDAVRTKADTGARTSAIDVANLEERKGDRVRFDVIADRRHPERYVTIEADIVRRTTVRSSIGRAHERIVVATDIVVGRTRFTAELGLVCRKRMLCRMLLGRSALSGRFVVDPSRMYVVSQRRRTSSRRREKESDS